MMNQIGQWTKSNQALAIVVVVVVGVLLGLAMWLGLDLSWVPGLFAIFMARKDGWDDESDRPVDEE